MVPAMYKSRNTINSPNMVERRQNAVTRDFHDTRRALLDSADGLTSLDKVIIIVYTFYDVLYHNYIVLFVTGVS